MMKCIFLMALVVLTYGTTADDDKVDKALLAKLGLTYTETMYSGYLSADDIGDAQFHYWFAHVNDRLPVTLWLNGGPGCSSAQGIFNENGPTNFIFKTATPETNIFKWTTVSNMIFLESPVGVGFSYGTNITGQNDQTTAKYNLHALVSFFKRFPQFQNSEFYISGESYAGIYIPTLASEIIDYNKSNKKEFTINLKGLLIGNGCTDPSECTSAADDYPYHFVDYLGRQNLISRATHQAVLDNVKNCYGFEATQECWQLIEDAFTEYVDEGDLNWYNIYGECPHEFYERKEKRSLKENRKLRRYRENVIGACDDDLGLFTLLRNPDFLTAFHINTEKTKAWFVCNDDVFYTYTSDDRASYYLYPKLIQNKIRIWKFSGDIDSVVPITGTLYWINKLQNQYNLRTLVEWRPWYISGDIDGRRQNAGNYWKLNGLTFVSVKDAGHMVPTDKRQAALTMFINFLQDTDLPEF